MSHLTEAQIALQLDGLPGWTQDGNYITKTFTFKSFVEAISFMTEVAFHAEEIEHHPEWTNVYDKVHVRLTTHDVSGISSHDIRLAKRMEQVFSGKQTETEQVK